MDVLDDLHCVRVEHEAGGVVAHVFQVLDLVEHHQLPVALDEHQVGLRLLHRPVDLLQLSLLRAHQLLDRPDLLLQPGQLLALARSQQFGLGRDLLLQDQLPQLHLLQPQLLALLFLLPELLGDLDVHVLAILLVGRLPNGGASVVLEEVLKGVEGLLPGQRGPDKPEQKCHALYY